MENNAHEVWQGTTDSTVWVQVKDPRVTGGWAKKRIVGRKKITLSVDERLFNQELIDEEFQDLDPFTNGLLVRTSPKDAEKAKYELTDEQLVELLMIDDDDTFAAELAGIESEVVVRRLLALAERKATFVRYQAVQAFVDDKYHVGKTSRVVKEIIEDDAKYADADL